MYDVNILVNGSRCKQYHHNGKIFIESKKGSEYTIEIRNNTWRRILAVCSVDGLDILSGKPAMEDSAGYVVTGYNTSKFDGFRVSNEKVAKFVFDYKNKSYASSKQDGSERNVGVIGVRIFEEKIKPPTIIEEHHYYDHYPYDINPWWNNPRGTTADPYPINNPTIWCDDLLKDNDIMLGSCTSNNTETYSCSDVPTQNPNIMKEFSSIVNKKLSGCKNTCDETRTLEFDMGTKFGEAKESRVIEVEFEKGILALSMNIYYASRQSLIEMGVPLGNEKQVSFPEPFRESKYATPPKGWKDNT